MGKQLPDKIPGVGEIGKTKPIQSTGDEKEPSQSFQSFMKGDTKSGAAAEKPTGVSPLDLPAQNSTRAGSVNMDSVLSQMNETQKTLTGIQKQLGTKNLNLKLSQKHLLRNKLTEASSQIRSASAKVGVDVGEAPSMMGRQNPVAKFLNLVDDGSKQMNGAVKLLKNLKAKGKSIQPGDLLLVQVKLAKAQQELEYTSVLLSKAVDDIKTIFSIQM